MRKTILALASLLLPPLLSAQEALKSAEEEYYDFLSLTSQAERPTLGYRTLSDSEWTITDENHIWAGNNLGTTYTLWENEHPAENRFANGIDQSVKVRIYGPEWYNSYNTAAPYGQNDGALWQGKGYNTSLTAGARLEAYGFEVTFKPQVSFSQNLNYSYLPGIYDSEYSYFWNCGIDLVQRYGNSAFWTYDWGDSEARWTWNSFTAGFGFQSPWLGPAWLNPMLGSNNAATYPKFDIGIRKTNVYLPFINWYIGDIEGRIWTGMLTTSDYFMNTSYDKHHMLNAMSASFAPSFLPNMVIGMNRIYITKWKAKNLKYLTRFITMSKANDWVGDGEDGKISLFADWTFSEIGFEVYGEYGIDDFPTRYDVNPFHTAVYTVGVKQIIPINNQKNIKGELFLEFNNFEMSQDFQFQWPYGGYYTHGGMIQGYTNKGQIVGAGSGYAGNSQFLGFKALYPKGSTFLYYHRSCPDNNYLYSKAVGASITDENIHTQSFKTIIAAGIEQQLFVKQKLFISFGGAIIKIQYVNYENNSPIYGVNINTSIKYTF